MKHFLIAIVSSHEKKMHDVSLFSFSLIGWMVDTDALESLNVTNTIQMKYDVKMHK